MEAMNNSFPTGSYVNSEVLFFSDGSPVWEKETMSELSPHARLALQVLLPPAPSPPPRPLQNLESFGRPPCSYSIKGEISSRIQCYNQ